MKVTGWDNGLSQDYCKELANWFSSRVDARWQVRQFFPRSGMQVTFQFDPDNQVWVLYRKAFTGFEVSSAYWTSRCEALIDLPYYARFGKWKVSESPGRVNWQNVEPLQGCVYLEMTDDDVTVAKALAKKLGYGDSTAYTSTSSVPGLYCQPRGKQLDIVIVKTCQGFVAMHFFED